MLSFIKENVENDNILVCSSILFLIPAYIAYQNEMYLHSIVTILASLISCHNWVQYRKTNKSTTLDIYYCRISMIFYLITGCFIVKSYILIIFGLIDFVNFGIFYYTSWQTVEDKFTTNMLHFLFHMCVLIGKIIVVSKL
jgi:hypothetical protein